VPWAFLQKAQRSIPVQYVTLGHDIETKGSLEHLVTVRLEHPIGEMPTAHKVEGHGSGDFAHLAEADGFIQIRSTKKGTIIPFFPLI
jgi:molybdopterin biosynthesis enzyme